MHDDELARVWYGRMVLPPKEAYSTSSGITYGGIRDFLVKTPDSAVPAGLGCSSMTMRALSEGNSGTHDEPGSCGHNEIFCWARCMALSDYDMDNSTCPDQNLLTQCVNPRGQVSDGSRHGDFYPLCTNATDEVTPYPPIEPGQGDECTKMAWEQFSGKGNDYMHHFNLTTDKTAATFSWSVVDDKVKARLSFNGLFGYLAVGFVNLAPGARHKGMNGAYVLMAYPDSEYTAKEGLATPKADGIVKEHLIDPNGSSFRHWKDAIEGSNPNAATNFDGCFTELTYEMDNINGVKFNTTGSDVMMWAGNGNDHFMGYHGRNRARFTVEWSTGVAYFDTEKPEDLDGDMDDMDDTKSKKDGLSTTAIALISAGSVVAVIGVAAFIIMKNRQSGSSDAAAVGVEQSKVEQFKDDSDSSSK